MISLMLLEKSLQTMIIYKAFISKLNLIIFLLTIHQINASSPDNSLLIGSKAPPVSLEKLNGDGFFHLEDTLKSKPVLLLFFSSKNYQSLKMISTIHQIKEGIRDSDIDFYLVNIFEEKEFLKTFVLDKVFTIPVVLDRYGISLKMFHSDVLPTTIVISQGGKISYYKQGYDDFQMENLILHLRSI